MIITLNQGEIENALQKHINDLMNLKEGVSIGYEFKMTRGEEGITVILDINNGPVPAKPAQVQVHATAKPAPAKAEAPAPAPVVKEEPKPTVVQEEAPAKPTAEDPPFEADKPVETQNQVGEAQAEASTTGAAAETGTAQNASAEAGAAEGAPFIKNHIIRVTEKAFDDFAGTGSDEKFNRKVLGLE